MEDLKTVTGIDPVYQDGTTGFLFGPSPSAGDTVGTLTGSKRSSSMDRWHGEMQVRIQISICWCSGRAMTGRDGVQ